LVTYLLMAFLIQILILVNFVVEGFPSLFFKTKLDSLRHRRVTNVPKIIVLTIGKGLKTVYKTTFTIFRFLKGRSLFWRLKLLIGISWSVNIPCFSATTRQPCSFSPTLETGFRFLCRTIRIAYLLEVTITQRYIFPHPELTRTLKSRWRASS